MRIPKFQILGVITVIFLLFTLNMEQAYAQINQDDPEDQEPLQEFNDRDAQGTFGLGGILGQPSGATVKYWFNPGNALDITGGLSLYEDDSNVYLHLSYLRHQYNDIDVAVGQMPYYFGIGGFTRFGDNAIAGVRVPLGLSYLFERDPLELFVEAGPMLEFTPGTVVHVSYGVGIRYYPGQMR